jgi:hypothetical protein
MIGLLHLPPELLSPIVDFVAMSESPENDRDDYDDEESYAYDCKTRYNIVDGPSASGLSYQDGLLATTPRSDVSSLSNLRLASSAFSQMCAKHLFSCVRLLPTEQSALHYNQIMLTSNLSKQVRKVVFQTRMVPGGNHSSESRQKPGPGDDYRKPHPFFMDALEQVGRFANLIHVEMVFGSRCCGPCSRYDATEDIDFREKVLTSFYAGLNDCEHPAIKVFNLSIKNLQDSTPQALIKSNDDEDIKFKQDFEQVMSRVTHLSVQVANEEEEDELELTLDIHESHNFFGHELQEYWITPIAENLIYFKLYANEVLFGIYPALNIPKLPKLRTLVLGKLSMINDDHIDWILSHAVTLEELIFDDVVVALGVSTLYEATDRDNSRIIYSPLRFDEDGRPIYQPEQDHTPPMRRLDRFIRWYHVFRRLQHGLPNLKRFVIGHGNWNDHKAFDEADTLQSVLMRARYQYLDRGRWLKPEGDWEEYNELWEDWQALEELLDELKRRR